MIMTSVMHTVDGCLYVECVCRCVHVCLKKNQNAPRPSEHPPASFVVSTFKSVYVYTGTGVLRLSSTILGAGDDLLSSVQQESLDMYRSRGCIENRCVSTTPARKGPTWSHVPWTTGQGLFYFFSVRTCSTICPFRV